MFISQDELWDKYDNVINKIEHKIELDDNEALDLAFLGKFISKKNAQFILESIIKVFNDSIIPKQILKMDVAVVIGGMILKHFPDVKKQKQLLERLKMNVYKSEMEKLLYEEFGDELIKKDEEIEIMAQKLASKNAELSSKDAQIASKDQELSSKDAELSFKDTQIASKDLEISKLKEEIKNISKRDDLNSSEIKDILNSLLNN